MQFIAFVEDHLSIAEEPLLTVAGLAARLTVGLAAAAVTEIAKGGNDAEALPSLTLITMPDEVPTFAAVGTPLSKPVAVLKLAHEGRFVTENDSVAPAGPLAVGWNEYALPATSVVAGAPEIVGGGGTLDSAASTWMENGGRVAVFEPSLAAIAMLE